MISLSMTPEEIRLQQQQEMKDDFFSFQNELSSLWEQTEFISTITNRLQNWWTEIDQMSDGTDLEAARKELDDIKSDYYEYQQSIRSEVSGLADQVKESQEWNTEIIATPTTYELLEWTETYIRIEGIITNNPEKFVNIPWNSPKEKVEYIFKTIRNSATEFLKNRLWNSEKTESIINNTIAPALEWNLLELLATQWSAEGKNQSMLRGMDSISFDSIESLFNWVRRFGNEWSDTSEAFCKLNAWLNAIDYLSVQEKKFWVLNYSENSEVLSNPLKFQEYLNIGKFSEKEFSVYENASLSDLYTLFGIDRNKTLDLWISDEDMGAIKSKIWNIDVQSAESVSLVWKLASKSEDFLKKCPWLQNAANHLLDWLSVFNGVTKTVLWFDILWEFNKRPEERGFLYRVLDFVCKLIWITWGLDWIVKNWRLDRLNLWDKTENIKKTFDNYHSSAWNGEDISVSDETSCKSALANFQLTDPTKTPTTKWDFLREAIVEEMRDVDVSLLSPSVVQQTLWNSYLKKETFQENWKTKERVVVNAEEIIRNWKQQELAQKHILNMKMHLEWYKNNNLEDFYSKIHNTDDLVICMISSLYADKNDVIEWVKAQVFFPESYRTVSTSWIDAENYAWRENLDAWLDNSDKQVVSEQWVYDKAVEYWITDNRQIAYVLSTIKWESWFKNQKEIWWENMDYWKIDSETWKAYYGRWFIQITHKGNYQKYTQIIRNSWKDFKDNNGNIIKGSEVDLVNNPDIILQSNDLAVFIAMDWMKNWWPYRAENKRLDYYINDNKQDFYNARIIINWMTSKPQEYADRAQQYLNKLWNWSVDRQQETKEGVLIWKELAAHNKDEIWGLWNSIMAGFQWYKNKFNFPNMDWEESKNTQTHPRRFNSPLDVQQYKAEHQGVKSFMFYFWANTSDNAQTLADITKWSEWFEEEWIQPVLCTCIWEDKHTWLTDLNKSLIDLWQRKNWPVFDFAKAYNRWDIAMWGGDSPHPTSEWYSKMANLITEQIKPA